MRKTTAKAMAALLALVMVLSLAGCGHEHTWADATCTTPKTCTECGETEGEALGHSWKDATCAAPKTCSLCGETEGEALPHTWEEATCSAPKTCTVCGETEGEPLPHTWREANFQAPQTCTVCGATEGDVLTPAFVTHNIQLTELGETRDVNLACYRDKSKTTAAHVTVTDYQIFESAEDFPAKEGYEYRQITYTVVCDDDNAWEYGINGWGICQESYYDIEFHDDNSVQEDDRVIFKANYNGEEIEFYSLGGTSEWGGWVDRTITATAVFTLQVPVGFDGFVLGIRNNTITWPEGGYIYDIYDPETFFMFRFA